MVGMVPILTGLTVSWEQRSVGVRDQLGHGPAWVAGFLQQSAAACPGGVEKVDCWLTWSGVLPG